MSDSTEDEAHHVAAAADVPEQGGLVVEVDGDEVAIFRLEDGYYGLDNVCTHQGGPVGEGKARSWERLRLPG